MKFARNDARYVTDGASHGSRAFDWNQGDGLVLVGGEEDWFVCVLSQLPELLSFTAPVNELNRHETSTCMPNVKLKLLRRVPVI